MKEEREGTWAAMERRIIVSGGDELRVFSLPQLSRLGGVPLAGADALLASGEALYCASDEENALFRLDAQTLLPTGVFPGGPGTRALCMSDDSARLYALYADADSVMMLDAVSGSPQMIARAGVGPMAMRMEETGERLVVAGGEDGCVYLLCARTLALLERLCAPGICCDAACAGGYVYALFMTQALGSELHIWNAARSRRTIALDGLPGGLLLNGGKCLAATQSGIYVIDALSERLEGRMPGGAGMLIDAGERLLLLDRLDESLKAACHGGTYFRMVCTRARSAVIV